MDIPEYVKPYINDWHCKVISVKSHDRESFSDPEVYSFFQACQQLYNVEHNLDGLKGIYLTRETAIAVGTVTGTQKLIEAAESITEGGMVNMCTALNNLLQEKMAESRAIGMAEGKSIGIAEGKSIGIAEGKSIGIAEGKSIGIAEGKSIGIAEGKSIGEANISIRLFKRGRLSLSEAAGECNLTEEEFIRKVNELV